MKTIQHLEFDFKYPTVLIYNKIPSNKKLKQIIEDILISKWHKQKNDLSIKFLKEDTINYFGKSVITKIFKIIDGGFEDYELEVKITEMELFKA